MKELSSPALRKSAFLFLLFLAVSIALYVRLNDFSYVQESLLFEDGLIFVNQSYELGWRSLWLPYGGYLFTYHRIMALLASQFPLEFTPYIFFCGWLVSFFSIVAVLARREGGAGFDQAWVLCLAVAIALQPNHGEPFFNLNHANFFFGIALALHICIPSQKPLGVAELALLLIASLTGPFSAFMLPILGVQLALLKDFAARKVTYATVAVCGLIQSFFILKSDRVDSVDIVDGVAYWTQTIESLLFFGKTDKFSCILASLFWAVTVLYLAKWIASPANRSDRIAWLAPLFAAATAALMFIIGVWGANYSTFAEPYRTISPLGLGSRYFLFPYSLAFFIALACTRGHALAHTAAITLIGMICASAFSTVDRADRSSPTGLLAHSNMQWIAFAKLQKVRPDVVIPVNVVLPIYPSMPSVQIQQAGAQSQRTADGVSEIVLRVSPSNHADAAWADLSNEGVHAASAERGPQLRFDVTNYCVTNEYLALEVDLWRSRMGVARVSWGQAERFDSTRSLERFYPAGSAVMQFAFRRDISESSIRFEPAEGVAESAIVRTTNYLDERFSPPQWGLVAQPTKPGGDVQIREVRLLCLE